MNEDIFRAYDIRGVADTDLTEEVVKDIGKALGTIIINQKNNEIIVGRDSRLSSPKLFSHLTQGITSTGVNVIDIGIVPTPVLYFATHKLTSSNGVVITGSHNPKKYNGFKIVLNRKTLSEKDINGILNLILEKKFSKGEGKIYQKEILSYYSDEIINNINLKSNLNIGIDCGNGAASKVAKQIYEELGCKVTSLFDELDGNFPNHHPDPSKEENMEDLKNVVLEKSLDLGIAFDGDADRLGIVTKKGSIIDADIQMLAFSKEILKQNQGGKIVFDVKCSKLLSDGIEELGGVPLINPTGHSLIKKRLLEEGALLGGEMSGHIFFNDRWPGFDDAIYAGARMLEIVSEADNSDLLDNLPKSCSTPEINISIGDKEKFNVVEEFKKRMDFKEAKIIDIDGIRVEFKSGWGLLRPSNTSPVLVLRFEATSNGEIEVIKEKFKKILYSINPNLGEF
ncbi:MAG: phosphomannomutase/phosphoglucomutase [Gammaproteobacteria bacterium]|nr:MAG: phosphomannomutase/phosphoglucomutase [Gammaproteobacteria bacterium]